MTWKGFLRWLRPDLSELRQSDYVKKMTPDELAERRRRNANRYWFGIQIFDPPKPHPHKEPWAKTTQAPERDDASA